MIPTKDNYVDWFTCAIRFYFMREGLGFLSFTLDQVTEAGFPAEQLVAAGNVAAGLNFARPAAASGGPRSYEIDAEEHERMTAAGSGLYYALPQTADVLDQQLTHQKVFFAETETVDVDGSRLTARDAIGFKGLAEGLEAGTCGWQLPAGLSAQEFLALTGHTPATLWLVVNRSAKLVFALRAAAG